MIEGQVAEIVNSRELAINRGSDHGVVEGMRFDILDPGDTAISDPETGETLGEIELVKIRVRVNFVEPKFSIAETYETTGSLNFGMLAGLGKVRTLSTADALVKPLSEAESYVKRGDRARQVEQTASAATMATITTD
jgi:hypothetical protein